MDITPLVPAGSMIIQSYGPGLFRVSGNSYEKTGLVVFPDRVERWAVSGPFETLGAADFSLVLDSAGSVDVALMGCGPRMQFAGPALRQAFRDRGIALEPMDTGAACRTYNVLLAEGRRVAAMLLPV